MDILERYISSLHPSNAEAAAVRDYVKWQTDHLSGDFMPSGDDDTDLGTYLLNLQANGAESAVLKERASALGGFYQWLDADGIIDHNPFDEYNFLNAFRSGGLTGTRLEMLPSDPNEREMERLRALSQIDEQLISSLDIQGALDSTLETTLRVMKLQAAWVSLLAENGLGGSPMVDPPPHGFALAAAEGLPPGLERDDRRFLRQPPACRCQNLLRQGRLTRPVNIVDCTRLRDSMIAEGDNHGLRFHASVPLISSGKPLGLLNIATTDWQFLTHEDLDFLSAVSSRLVAALERAHFYEVAERRRILLENELEIAREVQAGLMPHEMPTIPGFSLAWAWHPARQVGGDFYDIFPLEDGRWGIVIGDVADKGTAAALYMAMVHSLILSGALRQRSPAEVLMEVNRTLIRQSSSLIFVTVFLAVLDPKAHTLRYANAGHNPPLVRRASSEVEELAGTGTVIGVFKDLNLKEATISLGRDDAVVLYTDGVTEACNTADCKQDYGSDRLAASVRAAPCRAGDLLGHVKADLEAFTNGAPQQDDVTLLVLTRD